MPTPRLAHAQDAPELAGLHASGFDPAWSEGDLRQLLSAAGVFGLLVPGAGFILVQVAADQAELLTIAVEPGRRGGGIGRALLEAALGRTAALGAAQVSLEVAVDNAPALRLYQAAGFARTGLRRGYYARENGRVDAHVLTRMLPSPHA